MTPIVAAPAPLPASLAVPVSVPASACDRAILAAQAEVARASHALTSANIRLVAAYRARDAALAEKESH